MDLAQIYEFIEVTEAPTVIVLMAIMWWMRQEMTDQRDFYERIIKHQLGINGTGEFPRANPKETDHE